MNKEDEITLAKTGLLMKQAYFISTILFNLKINFSEDIPTAATNGRSIQLNPNFWDSINKKEKIFLLAHECYHIAFEHLLRRGDRDPAKFNMAGDYVINNLLDNSGYEFIKGGCLDHDWDDLCTEEIYNLLPEPPEDYDCDCLEPSEGDKEALEEEMQDIIIKAYTESIAQGEKAGAIPSEIIREINKLLNPKLPWQSILNRFMNDKTKEDYSWIKPNKRYLPEFYLPSLYSEKLPSIAIIIDTSGSINMDLLTEFLSEIEYINLEMNPSKITMLCFDTRLHNIQDIEEGESILDYKVQGHGGTDIDPVLDWVKENLPTLSIIFTDGYFYSYKDTLPDSEVLWAIYNNDTFEAQCGDVILINEGNQ